MAHKYMDAGGTVRTIKQGKYMDAGGTVHTIKQGKYMDAGGTIRLIKFTPDPLVITNGATSSYNFGTDSNYSSHYFSPDINSPAHYDLYTTGTRRPFVDAWPTVKINITDYTNVHLKVKLDGGNALGYIYIGSNTTTSEMTLVGSFTPSGTAYSDFYLDISSYTGSYYVKLRALDDQSDGYASFNISYWGLE